MAATVKDHSLPYPELKSDVGKDPSSVLLRDEHQPTLAFWGLNQLRRRNQLCDTEIRVKNAAMPAHKAVLAASSPYFLELLHCRDTETKSSDVISLEDTELEAGAIDMLVEFIYTSILRITVSSVVSLCKAAKFLRMERIERACCKFMGNNLAADNCVSTLRFAEEHEYASLKDQCIAFVADNLPEVADASEFHSLAFSSLNAVLESESMKVFSQRALLIILLKWIQHDPAERQLHLHSLCTSVVSLNLASQQEGVANALRNSQTNPVGSLEELNKLSAESKQCSQTDSDLVISSDDVGEQEMSPTDSSLDLQPTTKEMVQSTTMFFAAGGTTKNSVTKLTEQYSPATGGWSPAQCLPSKKSHTALVARGQTLYSVGGFDGRKRLSAVDVYDLQTDTWSEGPPLQTPRSGFGAVVVSGAIHCIGGYDGSNHLTSTEILDPEAKEWRPGPELLEKRSHVQATAIDSTIYALGGTSDGQSRLRSVEKLPEGGTTWERVADMNVPRSRPGVAAMGNILYAVGGYSGVEHLSSVECYYPDADHWVLIESMSVPRNSPAVAVMCGSLYVAGGHSGKKLLRSMERYDQERREWVKGASMLTARCDFGMVAVQISGPSVGTWT